MTEWKSGYCDDKELKKSVYNRLVQAKKDGVTAGDIEGLGIEMITIHAVYDVLNAKKLSTEMWEKMSEALKRLGY